MVFKEHCKAYIMEYSIRKRENTKDRLLFMALIKIGKFFLYSPTPCLPCSKLADYSKFGAKMGLEVFCFHTEIPTLYPLLYSQFEKVTAVGFSRCSTIFEI